MFFPFHLKRIVAPVLLLGAFFIQSNAFGADFDVASHLNACNVSWDVPGPTSRQSMPIGNGDIGLNVWVEPGGDLHFFIGKTDAWNEGGNLWKVGGVRISMTPSPLGPGTPFAQVLKLHEGEIAIKEGAGSNEVDLRVWVDANHPVIRVEGKSAQPVSYSVQLDDWRKGDISSQRIPAAAANQVVWYHRNPNGAKVDPHLVNLTFGAVMKGDGLVGKGETELDSSAPVTSQLISIVPLTATTDTPEDWLAQLGKLSATIDALNLEQTRQEHQKWWDDFWNRSWIFASGPKEATDVTEGYVLQRFVTACAGRGAQPIKFNGSIFTVDYPDNKAKGGKPWPISADYRGWGGMYWYQNTRAMYWPRLQAGDFDELMPLFHMYAEQVKANAPIVKEYYGHDGSYFAETRPFWGGLLNIQPSAPPRWTTRYYTDILDLEMMMLDYVDYTGDTKFEKETAIPMITAGLTFFKEHFPRDADGKLLLDPDNAIEMYWSAHDPAPDIAGLHAVLQRLIALPDDIVDARTREDWKNLLAIVPDLPRGERDGKDVLLPYTGPQTMMRHNYENPELYAVYPFRLYGLGQPDLDLARRTFEARKQRRKGCWSQDPIEAAMLGVTDVAADYVHFNLTRTDPQEKFWAFWAHGFDYAPDEDNGGNGENGLQQMLLQSAGKKLLVFPAWPKDWDVDFKLHASFQTTVQASFRGGKMVDLVVTPPERKADVVDMSTQLPSALP